MMDLNYQYNKDNQTYEFLFLTYTEPQKYVAYSIPAQEVDEGGENLVEQFVNMFNKVMKNKTND